MFNPLQSKVRDKWVNFEQYNWTISEQMIEKLEIWIRIKKEKIHPESYYLEYSLILFQFIYF